MHDEFWNIKASEIMSRVVITIGSREKVQKAAELMTAKQINALPVLHESGACVGILTSQNVVGFESIQSEVENELQHGYFFNAAKYGVENASALGRIRFDEVEHHMTRKIIIANPEATLRELAMKMCDDHSHHIIIMDEDTNILGIISSLDILAGGVGKRTFVTSS